MKTFQEELKIKMDNYVHLIYKMFRCSNVKMTKGFTLIEVVIAVFIVTVGILGAFSVVQQVVTYTAESYNRLVAAYLAQEGVEIARNIRDSNWLANANWQVGLTGCESGCEANYNDTSLTSYRDRYLRINEGFYNYSFGDDTKYKRKISIVNATGAGGSDILKVMVVVEWQEKGKINQFSVQENLHNWK